MTRPLPAKRRTFQLDVGSGGAGLFPNVTGMGIEAGLGTFTGIGFGLPLSQFYAL